MTINNLERLAAYHWLVLRLESLEGQQSLWSLLYYMLPFFFFFTALIHAMHDINSPVKKGASMKLQVTE